MYRLRYAVVSLTLIAVGCAPPRPASAPPESPPSEAVHGALQPRFQPGTPILDRPWTDDREKFTFAIIGDKTGGGQENWPIFDHAVDEVNLLRPDFAIMVGDLIQGGTRDTTVLINMWDEFFRHAGRLTVPFLMLPGNHDISNEVMYRWWKRHRGRTYYAFSYRGCRFIALNTEERWGGSEGGFGAEQVQFVKEALERHADARHTFVFMHKPAWQYGGYEDWPQIEDALGDRPYTVVAGHTHDLSYDVRNGNRYIIVGPTGAGLDPLKVPEAGAFHHWTFVTVDGDSAHAAYLEPGGAIWPENIAPISFRRAMYRLLDTDGVLPTHTGDMVTGGVHTRITNGLPDSATVTLELVGDQQTDGRSRTVTVASGESDTVRMTFRASAERLVPVPRLRSTVTYHGQTLVERERNVPLYPDSTLRTIPEWHVVGVFPAGPTPSELPERPRETMPKAFVRHGPEEGFVPDAVYRADDGGRTWRTLRAGDDGDLGFVPLYGTPDSALVYALCAVRSREARVAYAEFRADDYGQVFVNGEEIEQGRLFRTRRDAAYLALPLRQGWNTVVVKTINIGGGWSFRLRVADPDRTFDFAPHPQYTEEMPPLR